MPDSAPPTSAVLELFEGGDGDGVEEDGLPRVLPLPAKAAVPDAGLEAAYLATVEASAFLSAPRTWSTLVSPFKKMNVGIADTLYFPETSEAASTSHFRKLTFGYCEDSCSNVGAMA